MMRLWGGVCLVLGGGALGINIQRRQRRQLNAVREAQRMLETLRGEVCRMRTPLPLLLSLLREDRLLFEGEVPPGKDEDFDRAWRALISAMALDEESIRALISLGMALSRGADEENSFDLATEQLRRSAAQLEDEVKRSGRIPGTLGLCAGALLAILLA